MRCSSGQLSVEHGSSVPIVAGSEGADVEGAIVDGAGDAAMPAGLGRCVAVPLAPAQPTIAKDVAMTTAFRPSREGERCTA
jgi:hypothetical protein